MDKKASPINFYPFIVLSPKAIYLEIFMAGIYLHIPFCKSRCAYCDFHSGTDFSLKEKLVGSLCAELRLRKNYLGGESVRTIYFGGGTPSLLEKSDLWTMLNDIHLHFNVLESAETTIEANPDDITEGYAKMLRALGFNRISLGVQSLNDAELRLLHRRHSAQKARDAVKICQNAGFDNISIDLIYGLPAQMPETWENTLNEALSLNVQHISAYHLTYEKGTAIYRMLHRQVSEETSLDMFKMLTGKLKTAGFEHYEISNFAQKGFRSQHNSACWNDEKYLGAGASAHSYNGVSRQWNVSNTAAYIANMATGKAFFEIEHLTPQEKYNDFIITRLRTREGIHLSVLKETFGEKRLKYCLDNAERWKESHSLQVTDNYLALTEKGIFISDRIFEDLIWV